MGTTMSKGICLCVAGGHGDEERRGSSMTLEGGKTHGTGRTGGDRNREFAPSQAWPREIEMAIPFQLARPRSGWWLSWAWLKSPYRQPNIFRLPRGWPPNRPILFVVVVSFIIKFNVKTMSQREFSDNSLNLSALR
jgi:hypothetical protein